VSAEGSWLTLLIIQTWIHQLYVEPVSQNFTAQSTVAHILENTKLYQNMKCDNKCEETADASHVGTVTFCCII
jgi:hypothetical protein